MYVFDLTESTSNTVYITFALCLTVCDREGHDMHVYKECANVCVCVYVCVCAYIHTHTHMCVLHACMYV